MNVVAIILALGSIGFFASRAFLTAFVMALALRFGNQIPLVAHSGLLARMHGYPSWFTSNACLMVLGVLAVLEIVAQKSGEARRLLHEVDVMLKPALAALSALGVVSATDAGFVHQAVQHAGFESAILPLAAAAGTLWASVARRQVMRAVFDHLGGTSLGRLISWLEELWVVFGVFLLILFPIFMLAIIVLALGALMLARWRFSALEESKRLPCAGCGALVYPCAIACPSCKLAVARPRAIGFLGQSKAYPASDLARHPYRLAEKRRCPQCATRLAWRHPFKPCPACGHALMGDPSFATQYIGHVGRRLPAVLGICYLISSVPILGMIIGVVYFRIELVEPFYQYLPMGRRMMLSVGITLLTLMMVLLQWIPALGGLAIPVLALISFVAYRQTYRGVMLAHQASKRNSGQPSGGVSVV
jgi:hypothetical protein